LSLQLQKAHEVSLWSHNSFLREELHLLETSYHQSISAINRIKNTQSTYSQQVLSFRLQIDALQLSNSNNKFILYDQLTRYQSYTESINHVITTKLLELENQNLKYQLKNKEQPVTYCTTTFQKPTQIFTNRNVSLITPARTLVLPDRIGSTVRRQVPQSILVRPSYTYYPQNQILRHSNINTTSKKPTQVARKRVARENATVKKNEYQSQRRTLYTKPLVTKNY